jgi:hypothetical protein
MVGALALDEGIVAAKVVKGSSIRRTLIEFLRDDVASLCSHHYAGSLLTNK